jgi:phage tail-like protein
MATTSSYLTYLPPVLWSPPGPAGSFGLGSMLCPFEKVLTGIADGIPVTSGDGTVLTTVIQDVSGGPAAQAVLVQPGTGTKIRAGSSYTFDGATPEVISVISATANTITAVIRQHHLAGQAIVNGGGVHPDIQSVIAGTVSLYGAWTTPPDFFDWLAQWVALQASPAWDDYARRTVLAEITGIYAARGTRAGLARFFDVYAVARQRPRVVVDDAGKLLFCRPQAGQLVRVPVLVSQRPLVAPQCLAITPGGYLLVGDQGSSDSTIKPAIWRVSPSGDYDYNAGPPAGPTPFAAANAPVAIAADGVNGGAYLIDLITDYVLYRLTGPQTGTVTLAGTPTAGQTGTFTIEGTSYTFPQTGGATLAAQAAAWATALGAAAPFGTGYAAAASGPVISIAPRSGEPGNDLTLVATSSASLQLTAAGPGFAGSAAFASGTSAPPLGLIFPRAMVVNGAGHPLILDRGASVRSTSAFPPPSQTAVVDVQVTGTPPAYAGVSRHALAAVTEPLSMLLRADGSLVIGDGAAQGSAAPADLVAVDTATWATTSLLGGLPPDANPLVAPVGIVEADAEHLWVLDAGLRPYVPSGSTPFTAVIARQAALYGVDLSVTPPVVTQVSELGAGVYPRAMAGDGRGTLYACDSGLPDITGYSSRKWRSGAQQLSVVVQFQGNPARSIFCLTLSGTPASGETCGLTLAGLSFALAETSGNSLTQQAAAWAQDLNGDTSFGALYTAAAAGNLVCLYPAAGTSASGVAITASSSPSLTVTGGRLAVTVTLGGTPTTGESAVVTIGGSPYTLAETTGQTLAQQAAAWAATLNATAPFNQAYTATAAGPVLSLSYLSGDASDYLPVLVTPSAHLTLAPSSPPLAVGQVALSGTPTSSENGQIILNGTAFTLAENSGLTVAQQAAAWSAALNGTASFAAAYLAVNAADTVVLLATGPAASAGITLSAVSSAHLFLQSYSENQNRNQFLQSIQDVLADEVPAQARWYLQSELSQL